MRGKTLKIFAWFIIILFLMFAFPLQVITMSPYPKLIPYIIFFILLLITSDRSSTLKINKNLGFNGVELFILLYFFLFIIHSTYQIILGISNLPDLSKASHIYFVCDPTPDGERGWSPNVSTFIFLDICLLNNII